MGGAWDVLDDVRMERHALTFARGCLRPTPYGFSDHFPQYERKRAVAAGRTAGVKLKQRLRTDSTDSSGATIPAEAGLGV
jgi:hypothetical protein